MADILSFQTAHQRNARSEALSYLERMTAFQAEMQRLTAHYGILGHAAPAPLPEAEVLYHPALRRA